MAITHAFTSPKSDGADSTLVQPGDWNADHAIADGSILASHIVDSASQGIFNPGFETGDLTGWTTNTTGTGTASTSSARSHSGKWSAVLAVGASAGTTQILGNDYVPVTPNEKLTLSLWGFGSSSPNFTCYVAQYDVNKSFLSSTGFLTGVMGAAWVKYEGSFAVSASTAFVRVNLQHSTLGGSAYIDDVQLAREALNNFIPTGIIMAWSGVSTNVPAGWAICDGTNGTPDLTDRFIIGNDGTTTGSGGTISPAAALTTHATHSAHSTHTSPGNHDHGSPRTSGYESASGYVASGTQILKPNDNHTHSVSLLSEGGHTHDAHSAHSAHDAHAIYKYYKLALIMKL